MGKRKTEEGANHPDRDGQFRRGVLWKLSPWKLATSSSPRSSAPPTPTPAAGTTTPGDSSPSSPRPTPMDPKGPRGVSVRLVSREAEARAMALDWFAAPTRWRPPPGRVPRGLEPRDRPRLRELRRRPRPPERRPRLGVPFFTASPTAKAADLPEAFAVFPKGARRKPERSGGVGTNGGSAAGERGVKRPPSETGI
jgi:hypothetical protein